MAKVYYDKEVSLDILKKKTVAVVGYGAQGRAQALNLRDSGIKVIVSELEGTPNYKAAKKDGFLPLDAYQASKKADVIHILTQDTIQPSVYEKYILPNLKKGKAIGFSHGFNIHFNQIVPPAFVDVYMVAPKGPGTLVRDMYTAKKGVPCLVAVYQDATKKAKKVGLAYAKAIGGTRAGVIETTFREETETDLFGEQVVLCGGVTKLIQRGFETLVEAGYQPEIAYFECCHELKLITDLIYAKGIEGMRYVISDTAEYGDLTRGKRIVTDETKRQMKKILEDIQSGEFAREWILENKANRVVFNALRKQEKEHLIEKIGAKLRKMMPWIR
ncbi:MAG: ketol-acid reductoisomerase [Candidatus Omnitrophica bacterium 4484_171]|nr:MAG: ketol-acid reductoisomerase [Candidatus Omnitrophica bacterium 4484_171]